MLGCALGGEVGAFGEEEREMGLLVRGEWRDEWYDTEATGGAFQRSESQLRSWVTADGSPGPSGRGDFRAEAGRYILYVSYACPWAHRVLLIRSLKGLEALIELAVVHWEMGSEGWEFKAGEGVTEEPVFGARQLHQLYSRAYPDYVGRVTVPLLWDRAQGTIVSNESAELLEMLNSAFDGVGARAGDYLSGVPRAALDAMNARTYQGLNNGVYRAGFATSQAAYETAVSEVHHTLEWLEGCLEGREYLLGDRLSMVDLRVFPTLYRFDLVYHRHFRCSQRRLYDYPRLWRYTCKLAAHPDFRSTLHPLHIRRHYYQSHPSLNPSKILPRLPDYLIEELPGISDAPR